MENITADYLTRAETWFFITTLIYFLMNGAQIFETLVLVPKWVASPPDSFKLLADKNGISLKTFWIIFHAIHEITFILAIVFSWELEAIRNPLLVLFAVHFAVRVWTIIYFAKNIIEFQTIAETSTKGENLIARALLWQKLNYLRVAIFIVLSLCLIPLLINILQIHNGSI